MGIDAPLTPEDVTRQRFSSAFRGLDAGEVRAFLARVADELARTRAREEELRQELRAAQAAPPPAMDEETLMAALGEETARIVLTAQQAAADIKARAEENVTRILHDAHTDAERLRGDAEGLLATRQDEGEALAARLRQEAEAHAQSVLHDAANRSQQLVQEAEATRDRILGDLADRRRTTHLQVERLEAGRHRLLQAYEVVRRTYDEALTELERVEHEAPAAAQAAGRGDESAIPPPPPPQPMPEPVPAPLDPAPPHGDPVAPDPDAQSPTASALSPEEEEVVVLVSPELAVVEPPSDIESVRIIGPVTAPAASGEAGEVFARIRAERADAVTRAREVLAEPAPAPAPTAPETTAPAPEASEAEAPTPEPEPSPEPVAEALVAGDGADRAALDRRDALLEPLRSVLARKLKRALQDEQNDVLDRLRLQRRMPGLDELLLSEADQTARYREAVQDALRDAATAGAASVSSEGAPVAAPDVGGVAGALALDIVVALRRRLQRAIEDSLGSADPGVLADGVSAAYREWKSARVERLAGDHLAAAFVLGVYTAASGGSLRWAVDDVDGPCPDCDDNTLAGPTPRGERFPTGQVHPPAHGGCRCLLVPASA